MLRARAGLLVVLVAVLGTASTPGGLGHFSLTARVNAARVVLPALDYDGSTATVPVGDDYAYSVDLHATNVRLVASKRLAAFAVAGGLGWDRYAGDSRIQFREPGLPGAGPIRTAELELKNSRVMGFVNAGFDLSVVRLLGEVGYQGGRDQNLSTTFEDFDTEKGKLLAGLGLRFGF
jgi:hypothetical protein